MIMKMDAHYYAVLAFGRACGFKKEHAWDIAYASQFVDDAKINHIIADDTPKDEVIKHMSRIDSKLCFFDMATCHSYKKIKTFNYNSMIKNTVPFHFLPGCEGNNFVKQLRCREKGILIRQLFDKIIERGNLIELGIALHVFADTYSHQGFSGLLSKVNDIKGLRIEDNSGRILDKIPKTLRWAKDKIYTKFDKVIPAYGHAQAISFPDLPYLTWSYSYDSSDEFSNKDEFSEKIQNKKRFTEAFKEIDKILQDFLKRHPKYTEASIKPIDKAELFDSLIVKKSDSGRVKHWKKTIEKMGLFDKTDPMFEYNEHKWLDDAFQNYDKKRFRGRKVKGAVLASGFENSKWFSYYKAVHWYKRVFFECCENTGPLVIPR
jgi:hypothetical protein